MLLISYFRILRDLLLRVLASGGYERAKKTAYQSLNSLVEGWSVRKKVVLLSLKLIVYFHICITISSFIKMFNIFQREISN